MPKIVSEALQSRRSTQYCLLSKAHLIVNFTLSSAYTRVCSNQSLFPPGTSCAHTKSLACWLCSCLLPAGAVTSQPTGKDGIWRVFRSCKQLIPMTDEGIETETH